MGRKYKLTDGTEVTLRLPVPEDLERYYQFFNELPKEEKIYLRVDVSDANVVRSRLEADESLNRFRIVAEVGDTIVGEAVLEWPTYGWMAHVGEVRSIISRLYRRKGLASILFRELFIQAVKEGLNKIEARMIPQQISALKCLEKLGFIEEGRLPGFAMDAEGKKQDMIIMSTRLDGVQAEA